jgi:hypothetical protein
MGAGVVAPADMEPDSLRRDPRERGVCSSPVRRARSEKVALGIAGSFVGGLGGRILLHHGRGFEQVSSWIGSIIGSLIVLTIYMHVQQRRARHA